MRLSGNNLALSYESVAVTTDLTVEIPDGKITVLIGPNGCGKSTTLRALARLLKPKGGGVVLDGKDIHSYSTKEVARRLALLPQVLITPEAITVRELVAYGRHPQRRSVAGLRDEDREAIDWALRVTGTTELADRPVDQLSGGQRQRAWVALVLAQGTDLILLDEPTTFLDIAYQLEVLELLRQLNLQQGKTIVMVLHDINMAAEYAHHLFAMKSGQIVAQGAPKEIICRELVREVFGIDSHILVHPDTDNPLCVPIPEPGHVPSDDEDADRELSAPVG
jgi:ABC-type cobalamin/Fe3+-siderophores transport system ATPase subunit